MMTIGNKGEHYGYNGRSEEVLYKLNCEAKSMLKTKITLFKSIRKKLCKILKML